MGGFSVSLRTMKKYIIVLLGIAAFAGVYYLTGSWKWSLIILAVSGVYLAWVIGVELKHSKENTERTQQRMKKEHIESTKDNPTLR